MPARRVHRLAVDVGRPRDRSGQELGDDRLEIGPGLAGDEQGRRSEPGIGDEAEEAAGSRLGRQAPQQLAHFLGRAEQDGQHARPDPFRQALGNPDSGLAVAAAQRHTLRHGEDAVGRNGACRAWRDDVDRRLPALVAADGGQVVEGAQARLLRRIPEGEPGAGAVDARPQFIGRGDRAVGAVALHGLEADRVLAGPEQALADRGGGPLQPVGGGDRGFHHPFAVDAHRQSRDLRHHHQRVLEGDVEIEIGAGLVLGQVESPAARIALPFERDAGGRQQRLEAEAGGNGGGCRCRRRRWLGLDRARGRRLLCRRRDHERRRLRRRRRRGLLGP